MPTTIKHIALRFPSLGMYLKISEQGDSVCCKHIEFMTTFWILLEVFAGQALVHSDVLASLGTGYTPNLQQIKKMRFHSLCILCILV